jgi:hypothetical protein
MDKSLSHLKEKTWAFKTTNSVSFERKNVGILNDNLWQLLKEKTFFHFQDTQYKNMQDMNQKIVFPFPEYNTKYMNQIEYQYRHESIFFHCQNTNTKCRHESIRFSIARIPIQNADMNQFIFPLPAYQYKMQT